ncbi:MAG: DUF5050 domain-containing protein [Lachnospiraceae bacterium]|nr:DUF5050 domain-containing protein [Lachnospiraceae bacterium]
MKNKQLNIGIAILVGAITLSACGKEKNLSQQDTQISQADSQIIDDNLEAGSTEDVLHTFTEQPLDLETYSLDYVFETDSQSYFLWNRVAKSEYGYYYIGSDKLMFLDKKIKKAVPVCNRADCTHENSNCNAYLGNYELSGGISDNQLIYYDNAIYLVGYDSDGYTNMYKIKADGSSKEKYMQLYKADLHYSGTSNNYSFSWNAPDYCIHRGYLYYTNSDESQSKIYRMKLGSTKSEIIFEAPKPRTSLYRMLPFGDYFFFQMYFEDSDDLKGGLFAYNTKTGEIQLVKDKLVATYIVVGNTIYYQWKNKELRSFDLVTLEDKCILDNINEDKTIFADKQYLYTFNMRTYTLTVYGHDGSFVYEIHDENVDCWFGDNEYILGELYYQKSENYYDVTIALLDIDDFAEQKAKWEYFYGE